MTNDITATLEERGKRYGNFLDHSKITQALKQVIADNTPGCSHGKKIVNSKGLPVTYYSHLAPDQQEALDMICHKIGRILNGDPDYADSWHDIAGYAQLVADRLDGIQR